MYKLYVFVLFLLIIKTASGQLPVLHWAKAFNARNTNNYRDYSNGRSVAVDKQGNVYSAGLFQHTVDFDPGPGVYTLTGGSPSEYGIYISKLDAKGDFVWAVQIPVLVEFGDIEIRVDKNDNLYLLSDLRHPADMDPGPGVQMMTPIGAKDAFVVKLDGNGKLLWAKQFGGKGDTVPHGNALDIDHENNVVICGAFNNTVDFDPGPNTFNLTSTAHMQSYIAKLGSNGDFMWAKQFGNSPITYSGASIASVRCDRQGNIYTVGAFAGTCDFDPGAATYPLKAQSLHDGYVAKLDANGGFIWAKRIGNSTGDYYHYSRPRGIDVDDMNNVYTSGLFLGTHDFDPDTTVYNRTSNGGMDSYILKLNNDGGFVWVKVIGGSENDTGDDLAIDNANNVYCVGSYGRSVDFDPGPGQLIINSPYYGASVITKLNSNGSFIYAAPFQSLDYGTSLFRRMVLDPFQNIYVAGAFSGKLDFDPGTNVFPLTGSSDQSPFVLKLGKCFNATTSTLNINACNTYTLNNETFDSSGTYVRTIPNAAGCDSIITLNLLINKKFTQQAKAICEGEKFFAGGANRSTSGTYKDTLKTSLGCDSIVTTHLTVHPKPLPNLGQDTVLCNNTQISLTPGVFTSYLWHDMTSASMISVKDAGTYWVSVADSFNCTATDTFIVRAILPLPSNFLKKTDSVCAYENLEVRAAKPYNKYMWSTGAVENKIIVQKPGLYTLNVTDANGCVGRDSITIIAKECMSGVYIPTAFTPNEDGKNDYFRALVFGKVVSFKLQVFDRAGQLIFETSDPARKWDGRGKGLGYGTTVFVWQCFYHLENQQPGHRKGTVTLMR